KIKKTIGAPLILIKKFLFNVKLQKYHHIIFLPLSLSAYLISLILPIRAKRVLITNTAGLGDILMMYPLAKALSEKYQVDLIVNSREQVDIFRSQSVYKKVFFVDFYRTQHFKSEKNKFLAVAKVLLFYPLDLLNIFLRNYQAGIVCGHYWWTNIQEAAMMKAANIPKIIGFENDTLAQRFLNQTIKEKDLVGPALYLCFLSCFGKEKALSQDLYFEVDSITMSRTRMFLDQEMIDKKNKKIAVIHPGGKPNINTRQWPAENFRQVAEYLIDRDYWVFVTGEGDHDKKPCKEVAEGLQNCSNFWGLLSFVELGALLSEADVCISNDTSIVHLAEAVKCKSLIVIYGPSNSSFLSTKRKKVFRITSSLKCSPCRKSMLHEPEKECIYPEKAKCLKDIKPSQVIKVIEAEL
ncbi:MAG: glycosyltransferase family 9 protein, partial [Candidatus Omnitrophica bacterium]|nr:glycosyltransferase family 9 protein [Candidatus Omnitrophota bacterium]